MKYFIILGLLFSFSHALTEKCEKETTIATKVHWDYIHGKATLTASYNAAAKMKKACSARTRKIAKKSKESK